jgi:hypothetical protein
MPCSSPFKCELVQSGGLRGGLRDGAEPPPSGLVKEASRSHSRLRALEAMIQSNRETESIVVGGRQMTRVTYETGIEVSDERMDALNLKRAKFQGDWNYAIYPQEIEI